MIVANKKYTPEEIEENFKLAKPLFDKLAQSTQEENAKWTREIANLERRTRTKIVDIDIGDGDTIAVRTHLSQRAMRRLGEIEREKRGTKDIDAQNELSYEELEIVTANPLLTRQWFRENQDNYPLNDMVTVIVGFYEAIADQQREKLRRVKSATSFLEKPNGAELRGLPALHADNGPAKVGGPAGCG